LTGQSKGSSGWGAPLEDIKVLDFSTAWMGPDTTRALAAFGATVVKVESVHQHEIDRVSAPYKDNIVGLNRSYIYAAHNTGKRGITLNLKHPRSAAVIERLVRWADVVLENFVPGGAAKRGLDYARLSGIKPDIIVVSMSTQGLTGKYAMHPGYGFQLLALTGLANLTGWPDREPAAPVGSYTDYLCPWFALAGILSALDHRTRTGRGQFIEVSQIESAPQFLIPALLDHAVNGRVAGRCGNRSPCGAPHGAYRCRGEERWCVFCVCQDSEWTAFRQAIGSPEWTGDPRFSTVRDRKENEDELDRLVEAWTVDQSAQGVVEKMQSSGVPSGVVETVEDLVNDPQLQHRGQFQTLNHPEMGEYIGQKLGFKLSGYDVQWKKAAPCLGEDNEFVYTSLLGMSEEEFIELLNDGVLE